MLKQSDQSTYLVGKVNNVPIVYIKDENKSVPIRPICEAIGITYSSQLQKIKNNKILGSVVLMINTTGSDGKQYEMSCLPYKYIFGWLFSIDISRVNQEVQEIVETYQRQCYDVLYRHFVEHKQFVEEQQLEIDACLDVFLDAKRKFKNARHLMYESEKQLDTVRKRTFEEWKNNKRIQKIPFPPAN